jgi:hypothetical protein
MLLTLQYGLALQRYLAEPDRFENTVKKASPRPLSSAISCKSNILVPLCDVEFLLLHKAKRNYVSKLIADQKSDNMSF